MVYDLAVTITNFPQNMILKNLEGQVITPEVSGNGTNESPRVATITVSKYVPYNTEDSNRLHDETITWNWPYETGTGVNEINANDEIDTQDAGKEIFVSISVTGTQVLQEPEKTSLLNQITVDNYGESVDYSIEVNGVTLDNWKIFSKDANNVYMIYGDYLPNAAVTASVFSKNTPYAIYIPGGPSVNGADIINGLTNTSNWEHLLTDELKSKGATATGAPTLEQYIKSWNAKYPSDKLYTNTNDDGYYVGTIESPTEYNVWMSSTPGYSNTLYYPRNAYEENTAGYWLASPSAYGDWFVMVVECGGAVNNNCYTASVYASRPLVSLPSNVLLIKDTTSGKWVIE